MGTGEPAPNIERLYVKVSRKYVLLYVAEFEFRYNNRENGDIFAEAIRAC